MSETVEQQELKQSRLLAKLEGQIADAQAELDAVLTTLNRDKETEQNLKGEINRLKNKKAGIEREIATLEPVQAQYETKLDGLNEEIKVKEKEEGDKALKLKELDKSIENHEATVTKLKGEAKKEVDNSIKTESAELTKLKTERDALESEVAVAHDAVAAVRAEKEKITADKESIEEEIKNLSQSKNELEKAIEPAEKELKKVQATLKSTEEALATANADLKAARDFTKEEQKKHDALRKETQTLTKKRDDAKTQYETERAKLFNIANREKHVKQYELHVKKAFEEAGIPYTEFVPSE